MTNLQALESYSSCHPETFDELLEWPYRRFMKVFEVWKKRKITEELDKKRDLRVAASYANTNMDGKDFDRDKHVKDIEDYYEVVKNEILRDPIEIEQEQIFEKESEENNLFLQAGKRNLAKILPSKPDDIED